MHYRVTYLALHERASACIHAPNAASAVAVAEGAAGDEPHAFEVLSVVLQPMAPAGTPKQSAGSHLSSR